MSKKDDLFGKDIIVSGDSIISKKKQVISIGPSHNIAMGGIAEGTFGVISGAPKLGKTIWCLHVAACAQKKEYNYICPKTKKSIPRKVYYANIEGRLNGRDLAGIKGLITSEDRFQVIGSNLDRILDAGDYLEIVEKLIKEKPGSIFIMDSFSQLCSESRFKEDIRNRYRDDVPLLLSSFCKRISNIVPITNSIVMGVTHRIANQGQGLSPWVESAGTKIQYAADWKLSGLYKQFYPKNTDKPIGQMIFWQCNTSNLTCPGQKCESLFRYGYGIDTAFDLCKLCVDIGIINKKGSWLELSDGTNFQGMEKLSTYVRDNEDIYNGLLKEFKDLIG